MNCLSDLKIFFWKKTTHLFDSLVNNIGQVNNGREAGENALQHQNGVPYLDVIATFQASHQSLK